MVDVAKPGRLSILARLDVRFGGVAISGSIAIVGGFRGSNCNAATDRLGLVETWVSLALLSVPGKSSCGPNVAKVSDLGERIGGIRGYANNPETAKSLLDKVKLLLIRGDLLVEVE